MQKELTKQDRDYMQKHDLTEEDIRGFQLDMEMEAMRDRAETLKAMAEEKAKELKMFGYIQEVD